MIFSVVESELDWEDDTISWLACELVVVSSLLVDDSILKLESRSCVLDKSLTVPLEFNIVETDISALDVDDGVVSTDNELVSDERESDVWSLDGAERDEVIVNVVCSDMRLEFWLKVVDWVALSV